MPLGTILFYQEHGTFLTSSSRPFFRVGTTIEMAHVQAVVDLAFLQGVISVPGSTVKFPALSGLYLEVT